MWIIQSHHHSSSFLKEYRWYKFQLHTMFGTSDIRRLHTLSYTHTIVEKRCTLEGLTNTWNKVFKNGPNKICGKQPLKNLKGIWSTFMPLQTFSRLSSTSFIWSILEYFDSSIPSNMIWHHFDIFIAELEHIWHTNLF